MIFFYFLKIIFNISTSKRFKKYKPYLILTKKNSKFNKTQVKTHSQTASCVGAGWLAGFFTALLLIL
jgi:hypothetical protein